ncbi:MAG: hypothetical protein KC457_33130, partial [Myxococcales bacterium]|nr:hypothetical protein [Myxococcales bacterium]
MNGILRLIAESGPLVWPLVLLGFVGGAVALGLAAVGWAGRRVPAALWWAAPGGAALIGLIGVLQGLAMTWEALGVVDPEHQSTIAHAGTAQSFAILSIALVIAGILAFVGMIGAGSLAIRPDADAGRRAEHA